MAAGRSQRPQRRLGHQTWTRLAENDLRSDSLAARRSIMNVIWQTTRKFSCMMMVESAPQPQLLNR